MRLNGQIEVSASQNSGRVGNRLRLGLVKLSFNQGGHACCGNSLEKAAPTYWHNLSPDRDGNSKPLDCTKVKSTSLGEQLKCQGRHCKLRGINRSVRTCFS